MNRLINRIPILVMLLVPYSIFAGNPLKKNWTGKIRRNISHGIQAPNLLVYKPTKSTNYMAPFGGTGWQEAGNSTMSYTQSGKILQQIDSMVTPMISYFSRETHTYDAQDRETLRLMESYDSGISSWINSSRNGMVYDEQGIVQEQYSESWTNNVWVRNSGNQDLRTYNSQNKMTERTTRIWSGTDSAWVNENFETEFIYDAQQRLQSYILKNWDTTQWINAEKYIFNYTAGDIPNGALLQEWNGTSFVDSSRIIDLQWNQWTGYPDNSVPGSYILQKNLNGSWVNFQKITFTYDNFGSQTILTEVFSGGIWKNSSRFQQLIDAQLNPTFFALEEYNDALSRWDTLFGSWNVHSYDAQNRILETISRNFQMVPGPTPDDPPIFAWVDSQRKVYTSHVAINITGLSNAKMDENSILLFPNPVTAGSAYSISGTEGFYSVKDLQGRTLQSGVINSGQSLSSDGLTPGLYQVQVLNPQGEVTMRRLMIR